MFGRVALLSAGSLTPSEVVGFIYYSYETGSDMARATSAVEDSSGNLIIPVIKNNQQVDILKFNSSQVEQWHANVANWGSSTILTSQSTLFGCDSSGNPYLYSVGYGSGIAYTRPILTKILAADGSISTSKMYSQTTLSANGSYLDAIPKIASDGSIYIVERVNENSYLLNLNSSMVFQWAQRFSSTLSGDVSALDAIDTDSSGNVIVAGMTQTTTTANAAMIGKFDSSGNLLWNAAYSFDASSAVPGYLQYLESACFDDTGSYIYAVLRNNNTGSSSTFYNTAIIKINASNGSIIWTRKIYDGSTKRARSSGGINFDSTTGLITAFFPGSPARCVALTAAGNFQSSVSVNFKIGADSFVATTSNQCSFSSSGYVFIPMYVFDSVVSDQVSTMISIPVNLDVAGAYDIPDSGSNGIQLFFASGDTLVDSPVYKHSAVFTWGTATPDTSLAIESTQTPASNSNLSLTDGFIEVSN